MGRGLSQTQEAGFPLIGTGISDLCSYLYPEIKKAEAQFGPAADKELRVRKPVLPPFPRK